MADYTALRDSILSQLRRGEQAAISAARGAAEAAGRESAASTELGLRRSGITGAVGKALEAKNRARLANQAAQNIANQQALSAQRQANVTQTLGQADIQDRLARDMATQQMIGNIVSGLGGIAGSLTPMFLGGATNVPTSRPSMPNVNLNLGGYF